MVTLQGLWESSRHSGIYDSLSEILEDIKQIAELTTQSGEVIFFFTETSTILKWNIVANNRVKPITIPFTKKESMTPRELQIFLHEKNTMILNNLQNLKEQYDKLKNNINEKTEKNEEPLF